MSADIRIYIRVSAQEHRATLPRGPDPKWRFFWRVGERPQPENTRFPELNAAPVVPKARGKRVSGTWAGKIFRGMFFWLLLFACGEPGVSPVLTFAPLVPWSLFSPGWLEAQHNPALRSLFERARALNLRSTHCSKPFEIEQTNRRSPAGRR